jgi:hypothetical protein
VQAAHFVYIAPTLVVGHLQFILVQNKIKAMEELLTLKEMLLKDNIPAALAIVKELEEMGRNDIIKSIRSHAVILLLHLIKQQAENRTTRSWKVSLRNSVREIQRENKRRKARGYYLTSEELLETFEEAY